MSGLFFLREGPFAVAAVNGLRERPDLVCFDAHGISHPRHAGLATICGMILDIPSIGVAKSKLIGDTRSYKEGLEKMVYGDAEVGFVTRYEGRAKRYWSPGYRVSLEQLEMIISRHSEECIKSIEEADHLGRSDIH
jgi:deoxyribonuclease V